MRKIISSALLVFVILIIVFTSVSAQRQYVNPSADWKPTDDDFIIARLTLVNPEAVPSFKEGSVDLFVKLDYEAARQKFEEVLKLAPDFPEALLRVGQAYASLDKNSEALAYYLKAVAKDNSPENRNEVAFDLLSIKTSEAHIEALRMIKDVISEKPDDLNFNYTAVLAALIRKDYIYANERAEFVLEKYPDLFVSHYLAGLVALSKHNLIEADNQFQTANKLGAPKEMTEQYYSDPGFYNQLLLQRTLFWGVVGFAGWIVLFIILFFSGIILSNLTMKAIKKQVQFGVSKTTPVEKFLRWIYGIVIWVASGYFYISIPILILLIILSVAGLEYLLVLFGLVPFTLAMAILLFGFFTVVAIIRSLFIRRSKDVPGKPLSRQEVPELWRLLTDIASRLSTRPVKKVFVTPNTGIAVFERGNWLNKISNRGERCLILGLDTLNGLTLGEFQSVIAHEYGHFINADTARGNLAKRMQNNFLLMITTMSRSKLGGYYFPMFFFISLYNKIFLRISHGASRLQEIQADRLAASYFGISIFKKSLKHVIRNTIVFRYHLDQEVKLAQSNHTSLRNLYSILSIDDFGSMERDIRKVMNETTSPYDSHPSLMERFELIRNVSVRGSMVEDTRLVWDLLPNAENLQMEMTKNIEANLKLKGYLDPAQTGNS